VAAEVGRSHDGFDFVQGGGDRFGEGGVKQVKVTLSAATMLLAGQWMLQRPLRDNWNPLLREFFEGMESRGRRKGAAVRSVALDRESAEILARSALAEMGDRGIPTDAEPGFKAVLQIFSAIIEAVMTPTGRPMAIDPIEAFERNETHKKSRGPRSRGNKTSVEVVAEDLRVTSRSVDAAIAQARPIIKMMQAVQQADQTKKKKK
jgi:hypothetical protein